MYVCVFVYAGCQSSDGRACDMLATAEPAPVNLVVVVVPIIIVVLVILVGKVGTPARMFDTEQL